MNLSGIKHGDIVMCDVRGDRFYGEVATDSKSCPVEGRIGIDSLMRRPIPAHTVTARQVIGHWRKSKQSKV